MRQAPTTSRRSQSAVQTRVGSSLVLRVTLVILELFVGIGGIFGGLEMIRDPLNPLGMTTELIAGSPFDTYTSWPGILLLVLVGVTPCVLAVGLRPGGAALLSSQGCSVSVSWPGSWSSGRCSRTGCGCSH